MSYASPSELLGQKAFVRNKYESIKRSNCGKQTETESLEQEKNFDERNEQKESKKLIVSNATWTLWMAVLVAIIVFGILLPLSMHGIYLNEFIISKFFFIF